MPERPVARPRQIHVASARGALAGPRARCLTRTTPRITLGLTPEEAEGGQETCPRHPFSVTRGGGLAGVNARFTEFRDPGGPRGQGDVGAQHFWRDRPGSR